MSSRSVEDLERELAAAVARAEAAERDAAVGRMAAMLAHDLNNPLTVLQLRADLLGEDDPPPRLREQLGLLEHAVERVARAVWTFQRVTRPHQPGRELLALADLVERAIALLPSRERIRVEPIPPDLRVRGDDEALVVALEQALRCAGDAEVRAVVEGARVRIEIAGEPTASDEPIPERERVLARAMLEVVSADHAGRGGAEGTWFLELPLATGEASRTGPARVLVVDDEPLVASVLAEWCRRRGHTCRLTASAEEAKAALGEDGSWDAVLVDERLPGASGAQLLSWMAVEHPALLPRAALMSGSVPASATPWAFLSKPFTHRELSDLVETLLTR